MVGTSKNASSESSPKAVKAFLSSKHANNFSVLGFISYIMKLKSTQCGHFRISVMLRFYGKSILENPEVLKLPFCYMRGLEFCYFGEFQPPKSAKMFKCQNSEPLNVLKWHILHF